MRNAAFYLVTVPGCYDFQLQDITPMSGLPVEVSPYQVQGIPVNDAKKEGSAIR